MGLSTEYGKVQDSVTAHLRELFDNRNFFGDIGKLVWGKRNCEAVVGKYLFTQRGRENYPWWRVVNQDDHPVADAEAVSRLQSEGHKICNGKIIKKK